jgi:hypothetical protein
MVASREKEDWEMKVVVPTFERSHTLVLSPSLRDARGFSCDRHHWLDSCDIFQRTAPAGNPGRRRRRELLGR